MSRPFFFRGEQVARGRIDPHRSRRQVRLGICEQDSGSRRRSEKRVRPPSISDELHRIWWN